MKLPIVLLFCITTAFAQTATIRGHTVDRITRDPAPGIVVQAFAAISDTLPGDVLGMTASDLSGQYVLENLKPTAYILHAAGLGYESDDIRVSLDSGVDTLIDIELRECVIKLTDGFGVAQTGPLVRIAGKSAITGYVRDAVSKRPLPDAKIILSSRYRTEDCNYTEWCCTEVTLDSMGQFSLSNLAPGRYTLSPQAHAYASDQAVSVTTIPDSVHTVAFDLIR